VPRHRESILLLRREGDSGREAGGESCDRPETTSSRSVPFSAPIKMGLGGKDVPGTFAARDGGEDRHRRGLLSFSCLYAALAPVMAYERATVK